MSVIMLSHALHPEGMDLLACQQDIKVMVANQGDLSLVLDDFRKADGFILRIGRITREMIEGAPNLKVITRPGVGVDAIDVEAATEQGIPVVITPGANVRSVAEHTLTMLFALSKNLVESHEQTKAGNFGIRNKYAAFELEGKTLGVLGFGNIGRETARLGFLMGLQILVYDPYVKPEAVEPLGYKLYTRLEDLLPQCDAVTLHMPSTPQTRNTINADTLAIMKPGALLINCARGDLVEEDALYRCLLSGHLAGAAADMMVEEPMNPQNPLFTLPNFIVSPHMAALTRESASRSGVMAAEGTLAVIRGQRWPYVCNPKAYKHPKWNERKVGEYDPTQ